MPTAAFKGSGNATVLLQAEALTKNVATSSSGSHEITIRRNLLNLLCVMSDLKPNSGSRRPDGSVAEQILL